MAAEVEVVDIAEEVAVSEEAQGQDHVLPNVEVMWHAFKVAKEAARSQGSS